MTTQADESTADDNVTSYNREDIIRRVQGVLERARRGGSEAEMATAAAFAQRLMTKYNLAQAELEIKGSAQNATFDRLAYSWRQVFGYERATWQLELMDGIADVNMCTLLFYKRGGKNRDRDQFYILGKKPNIEMVIYFGTYLDRQMRALCEQRHAEALDTGDVTADLRETIWKQSYLMGLAGSLTKRLRAEFASMTNGRMELIIRPDTSDIKSVNIMSKKEILIGAVILRGQGDAETVRLNRPITEADEERIEG